MEDVIQSRMYSVHEVRIIFFKKINRLYIWGVIGCAKKKTGFAI